MFHFIFVRGKMCHFYIFCSIWSLFLINIKIRIFRCIFFNQCKSLLGMHRYPYLPHTYCHPEEGKAKQRNSFRFIFYLSFRFEIEMYKLIILISPSRDSFSGRRRLNVKHINCFLHNPRGRSV